MKKVYLLIIFALALVSCGMELPSWVIELENKNPIKDNPDFTSVYFRFDTIINDFQVSGIFYPSYSREYGWDAHENGARIFFHNLKTDKEYVWTDWDDESGCFKSYFMSKNVANIVSDKKFRGYKNGDYYVFQYDTTPVTYSDNDLLPYAEYQFYDADFDGTNELILGMYTGGPYGSPSYEIYEMTDSGLILKRTDDGHDYFFIDTSTKFDAENKVISNTLYDGAYAWGVYTYKVDEHGDLHRWYHASFVSDFDHNIVSADTTFFQ